MTRRGSGGEALAPTLIVAGVMKAATTSLFQYLSDHPAVCGSDFKELNHFDSREPARSRPLEDYSRHYAHRRQEPVLVEASPRYAEGGRPLCEAIDTQLPDVRIVMTLREPVARLWSHYTFEHSQGHFPPGTTFTTFLDRSLRERAEGSVRPPFHLLGLGIYTEVLAPWIDTFGTRLRIVFLDDLAADPGGCIEGLLRWCDVTDLPARWSPTFAVRNSTQQPRSVWLKRRAYRAARSLAPLFSQYPALKRASRAAYARVNHSAVIAETLSESDRQRACEFYAPTLAPLRAQLATLGRVDVPSWVTGSTSLPEKVIFPRH